MSTLEHVAGSIPRHTYSAKILKLVAACFFLSGATGLIYEVLWARMLGLVFGGTTLAVSTVLAAFMGGLALGSALSGRFGSRITRPVRAYGLLEIGIAVYALAVPLLFSLVDNLYALIWQQFHPGFFVFSLWRFVLSCLMLLVPTTLMGATLPLLSAALLRASGPASTSVTKLYTRNLAGAIFGTIVAGFFLLPILGVRATIYTAAAINIVIGLVSILAERQIDAAARDAIQSELVTPALENAGATTTAGDAKFWLACAFVSGFVTISTQVAWTRLLTMIVGSSTYAFSIVVALFLVGLAAGAYVIARSKLANKLRSAAMWIELVTAVSLFASLIMANKIPTLLITLGLRFNVHSWGGLLALQIFSVALLLLIPAFMMGMVMPLVLVWAGTRSTDQSVQLVGRSYAVNTIGAISGAFLTGFVLIPNFSTRSTVLFAAALCIVVAAVAYQPPAAARDRDLWRAATWGATVVVILVLFFAAPRMNMVDLSIGAYDSLVRVLSKTRGSVEDGEVQRRGPEIHQLLMYEEGTTSTVTVRKDWDITSMAINGRTNASDRDDMATQVMLGQMPLLLAPKLDNALIVGYATGVTAGSMLQSPIQSIDCLELEPATVNGSRFLSTSIITRSPIRACI